MKILITGISGLLGNNLAAYFRKDHEILGLFNRHPVAIEGVRTLGADLRDYEAIRNVTQEASPQLVIHCASTTDIDGIEVDQESGWQINVLATRVLLDALRDIDAKIIYISSDSVYPGDNGPYSEMMATGPKNWYGATKLKGESLVLSRPDSLVLRTNLYGWNIQNKKSLAEWFIDPLKRGERLTGFIDARFSSIYTMSLARLIEECLTQELSGVFNCACSDAWSKYEFGRRIAGSFGFDPELIEPRSIKNHSFKANRGKDLSLDVSRLASALGHPLPTMQESLNALYQDWNAGLPRRIKGYMDAHPHVSGWPYRKSITYGGQVIGQEDIDAVVKTLKSSNLTQGPMVDDLEKTLGETVGSRHVVAVNSGTSALHIACLSCDVGPGDEVITSPNTFVASANCAIYCGATPIFADIEPRTYNISPKEIEKKITEKTRAIIPVHFAGQSCDMERIQEVVCSAEKKFGKKIYIIEDACHALGSLYKDTKIGSCVYADMAVMSFHPVKHITTAEGGAVFTKNALLFKKLKRLRSHGITNLQEDFINIDFSHHGSRYTVHAPPFWYYEQIDLGYNYRITDIQCALGISQLRRLEEFRERRRKIVNRYNEAFSNIEAFRIPFESGDCSSNFHLYVLLLDFERIGIDRANFMQKLKECGIQTQVHYIPVHTQPYYQKNFNHSWGDFPNAEHYYNKCLSIPLFPAMTDEDVERVIYEIKGMVLP
nr:UDP-4-amino-4,6-dideoxy-N-acetyl-beta-L-altrosamine transaminase [Desulfobacterales bacterium]